MKPLSEQDSRKLFFDRIFGSEDACPSELRKASSGILKKCGGLPLAIMTMASMLACHPKKLEGPWDYILNSLSSKFATSSNYEDMMHILDLSYKNLPRQLKACFLYLGSYPEDHNIGRDELVRRWVAEGFVSNSSGQDVWDVAESYYNDLINRSMIQPSYDPSYDDHLNLRISGCRVHDMLLELIVRRCKEDNFLSLVNNPQAVVELQDKVIRRLNIVALQGTEVDKVIVTTSVNLAQIRSLSILGQSNWVPSLLEFKFVRVLSFDIWYSFEMAVVDLTVINQLSQVRYLKVSGDGISITLPCEIRGLRLLETLDLSGICCSSGIPLEIVDVPRLSHLAVPRCTRLPDWIGKVKSLRTLSGFSLLTDSLEGTIGLGELIALSDLDLYFTKGFRGLSKATWMTALSNSLGKLGNLKQLKLYPVYVSNKYVALCADALSSLSPPFRNLEVLNLQYGFTFPRVPRWIGYLHSLRQLRLGAKQVLQEDITVIGTRLPSLGLLGLRIPEVPKERIMIGGSTGFPVLRRFGFDCDGTSFLKFEAGAMPALRELELVLDEGEWDKAAPAGLHHLLRLEKITTWTATYDFGGVSGDSTTLMTSVFQEAADALPTRPAVSHPGGAIR